MVAWLIDALVRRLPGDYRHVNRGLLDAMVLLWAVAWLVGWVYSIAFVSHVSMLALVIGVWSALRSDEPAEPGEDDG